MLAWIRAEDGGIADLAGLAARLGLLVAELAPEERAPRALDWLSGTERRWLLVLDNIASRADLEACVPRSGNGRVLIITRDRTLARYALLTDARDGDGGVMLDGDGIAGNDRTTSDESWNACSFPLPEKNKLDVFQYIDRHALHYERSEAR